MGVVFAVRGNSLDARFSRAGKTPGIITNTGEVAPAVVANGSAFGGFAIDQKLSANGARGLIYPGRENLFAGPAFTIITRIAPNYSGNPSNSRLLFGLWGSQYNSQGSIYIYHRNTDGKLQVNISTTNFQACVSTATTYVFNPTAGQFYDIILSWDGVSTGANIHLGVNGVLVDTLSAFRGLDPWDRNAVTTINLGGNFAIGNSGDRELDEFVILDTAEDVTSFAGRSDYVEVASLDGQLNTSPQLAEVSSGVTWYDDGVLKTGTKTCPVSVSPGEANVRENVSYTINDEEEVGTLVVPDPNAIAFVVNFDEEDTVVVLDSKDQDSTVVEIDSTEIVVTEGD